MFRFKRSTVSKLLLTCGVLLGLTAGASAAPFQQYKNGVCPGRFCAIKFATVPAGKQRIVRNMSCLVRLNDDVAELYYVVLQARRANDQVIHSVILETSSGNFVSSDQTGDVNQRVFNINAEVLATANVGGYFLAQMDTFGPPGGAILQFDCGISGDQTP
jgi:hypothetical protein